MLYFSSRSLWFLRCFYTNTFSIVFFILIGAALYFEWFVYYNQHRSWKSKGKSTWKLLEDCGSTVDTFKILLVADPQILGENTESWIARTDNDKFLKSTFHHAVNFVNPDLIIFLGDLMDEGSIADPEQYQRYYARFRDIFYLDSIPENKIIFVAGDNDIGGENEDVTPYKVKRFEHHFGPLQGIIKHGNINFFKVESMTHMYPRYKVENDTSIRIAISHMPLLGINQFFGEEVLRDLKPHAIFSAHDHKLMHFVTGYKTTKRGIVEVVDVTKYKAFRFSFAQSTGRINEISVPTASYRMGTIIHGYSAIVIDKKNEVVCYYFLNSPMRLIHLTIYLFLIIFIFIYSFCVLCIRKTRKAQRLPF